MDAFIEKWADFKRNGDVIGDYGATPVPTESSDLTNDRHWETPGSMAKRRVFPSAQQTKVKVGDDPILIERIARGQRSGRDGAGCSRISRTSASKIWISTAPDLNQDEAEFKAYSAKENIVPATSSMGMAELKELSDCWPYCSMPDLRLQREGEQDEKTVNKSTQPTATPALADESKVTFETARNDDDGEGPPAQLPGASLVSMKPSDFTNQKYLAHGSYGTVYEATFQKTGDKVAIKKLVASRAGDSWKKEVEVLSGANHPHIVSIIGVVENLDVNEIWIVTEFMNGGSLRPYCTGSKSSTLAQRVDVGGQCCTGSKSSQSELTSAQKVDVGGQCGSLRPYCTEDESKSSESKLTLAQKVDVGGQCWSALCYLHDTARITHKDIKPENILLHRTDPDGQLIAKLCDFGLAERKNRLTITEETKLGGTWMYYPPEFADSKRNPRKADVYSLGATMCELFTTLPFWHWPHERDRALEQHQVIWRLMAVFRSISAGVGKSRRAADVLGDTDCPVRIQHILKQTVHFDRKERPSASEVLGEFLC